MGSKREMLMLNILEVQEAIDLATTPREKMVLRNVLTSYKMKLRNMMKPKRQSNLWNQGIQTKKGG